MNLAVPNMAYFFRGKTDWRLIIGLWEGNLTRAMEKIGRVLFALHL